jgi:hypothetical protein
VNIAKDTIDVVMRDMEERCDGPNGVKGAGLKGKSAHVGLHDYLAGALARYSR